MTYTRRVGYILFTVTKPDKDTIQASGQQPDASPQPKAQKPKLSAREIQKLHKRLKKNPSDQETFTRLSDEYVDSEKWEALADLLTEKLENLLDKTERLNTLIKLGSLYDEKLSNPQKAIELFEQVLKEDPGNHRAVWTLGFLYHDQENWEKVIEIFLQQIEFAQAPEEKLQLRAQLAQIYEQRLNRQDQALLAYVQATREAPQNIRILFNLEKIAQRTGGFSELLAVYEDVVEHIQNLDVRIAITLKLGYLVQNHIQDNSKASGYFRRALELCGEDIQKLFSISNIFGEDGQWEELVSIYSQLIQLATSSRTKSRIRRELARLYRQGLNDVDSAFFELVRVARYNPDEEGLIDELINVGIVSSKQLELAAVLREMGVRLQDKDARVHLYTRLAALHIQDTKNLELAHQAITQALEAEPANIKAQLLRFDLLEAGEYFKELAQALESFLSRPDLPPEVIEAQSLRLASLRERIGSRVSMDPPALRGDDAVFSLPPMAAQADEEITQETEATCKKEPTDDDKSFPVTTVGEPEIHDPDKKGQAKPDHAFPSAKPLESIDTTDKFEIRLPQNPNDPEAWIQLASTIAESKSGPAAFDTLAEGLERVSQEEAREKLLKHMSSLAKTSELKIRLGELLEERQKTEDAESNYRSVLRKEPANAGALDGLFRILRQQKGLTRFKSVLNRALKEAKDPKSRKELRLRRARLLALDLDQPLDALKDVTELLQANDSDLSALTLQEEILESLGRHEELAKVYEHHLKFCDDTESRVDQLTALAELYERYLNDRERAIQYYQMVNLENPKLIGPYHSLTTLLEQKRDWLGAVKMLREATSLLHDSLLASQLYFRLGKILQEQLLRPEEAEEAYQKAIATDPPNQDALTALASMARQRSDWVEVIRLEEINAQTEKDEEKKAQAFNELAKVWREHLDNPEKAAELFEQAHALDPNNLEAGRMVAEARVKSHRPEEAHELLSRLAQTASADSEDKEQLAAIHVKLAQTAEALGHPDQAQAAFEKALELSPAESQVITQYGYFLARQKRWEKVAEHYQRIFEQYSDRLPATELADLHCLMAQALIKLDRPEDASAQYREALKFNPRHLPALRACVNLAHQLGNYLEVISILDQLRGLVNSAPSRFKLAVQIGDILADQMHRYKEAAEAYGKALEEDPDNLEVLEKLRRTQLKSERYEAALQTLEHLSRVTPSDQQRARYFLTMGEILRERLDHEAKALKYFLRTLVLTPLDRRAFSAAVKILSHMRDWPRLALLYEELLKRIPPPIAGQADRRVDILTELADIYRYHLEDRGKAISACERLLTIFPANLKVLEDLARLYEADGRLEEATALHRTLISESPFSIDSYHALRRIFERLKYSDRTLCLSATISFMGQAREEELAMFRQYRQSLPIPPGPAMTEAIYRQLFLHPKAAGLLGQIFSLATEIGRPSLVTDAREFRLKSKERISLSTPATKTAATLIEALGFLGLPPPEVYNKPSDVKGFLAVNTSPVAVLYSEPALQHSTLAEIRFMAARALAFTRPENLLALSLSPVKLHHILQALLELAFPGSQLQPLDPDVASLAQKFKKVLPTQKESRLHQLMSKYKSLADELPIVDWQEGIEHTCNRIGFAYCGDLEAAVSVLKGARVFSPTGSHRSLIRELIFYSISDDYFDLREELGVAIQEKDFG